MTLFSGPSPVTPIAIEDVLDRSIHGITNLELRTVGIGHAPEFTRTLFVRLQSEPVLVRFSNELRRHSPGNEDYILDPHLSLLYAPVSEELKAQLVREIRVPERVWFDAVQAIASGVRTSNRADVERWEKVAARGLHSA